MLDWPNRHIAEKLKENRSLTPIGPSCVACETLDRPQHRRPNLWQSDVCRKLTQGIAAALLPAALAGCLAAPPENLPPMPDQQVIEGLAKDGYVYSRQKQPVGFEITKLGTAPILGANPDHYACAKSTEAYVADVFRLDGSVLHKVGDRYTATHIMVFRYYPSQSDWGVGIFRTVSATTKVGGRTAAELCTIN